MDIPHGNWVIHSIYPDFRIGSRVQYECEKDYKAIGQSFMECQETGYWSEYAPKCLPKGELSVFCFIETRDASVLEMCRGRQCRTVNAKSVI